MSSVGKYTEHDRLRASLVSWLVVSNHRVGSAICTHSVGGSPDSDPCSIDIASSTSTAFIDAVAGEVGEVSSSLLIDVHYFV